MAAQTPLVAGNPEEVRALRTPGTDVTNQVAAGGSTELMYASPAGQLEYVRAGPR